MYIHHLLYSEQVIIAQLQLSNFSAMSWQEQVTFKPKTIILVFAAFLLNMHY
jgi:hypothetical protein